MEEFVEFFDCNNKTNNPQNQDDLKKAVLPGFTWSECIPPKVEVLGNGTKTAVLIPIVSSPVDGSILTLEIIEPGEIILMYQQSLLLIRLDMVVEQERKRS